MRPVVHYMMGGIHTDIRGATSLEGLYAAGEVACVSINGANRLGSNSLPECLVFGNRAGRAAAVFAGRYRSAVPAAIEAQGRDEERRLTAELARHAEGHERIADIRTEMQTTMENGAGIYRDGDSLAKAADQLEELQLRFAHAAIDDHSRTSTPSWSPCSSSGSCSTLPRASSPARRAGRSRAVRTSAPTSRPATTSGSWRIRWSGANRTGRRRVTYLPVTITRWPPGERVYGR